MICHPLENYPWAYEMKVEDPDSHVLRFGSKPKEDRPFVESGVHTRYCRDLRRFCGENYILPTVKIREAAELALNITGRPETRMHPEFSG